MADAAGQAEFNALKSLITSNLGLTVALVCTAYGAYLILVKQQTKTGLVLLIAAAGIPLLTGFMDGIRSNFCPAITMLGGDCGEVKAFSDGTSTSGNTATPATQSAGTGTQVNTAGTDALSDLAAPVSNNGRVAGPN